MPHAAWHDDGCAGAMRSCRCAQQQHEHGSGCQRRIPQIHARSEGATRQQVRNSGGSEQHRRRHRAIAVCLSSLVFPLRVPPACASLRVQPCILLAVTQRSDLTRQRRKSKGSAFPTCAEANLKRSFSFILHRTSITRTRLGRTKYKIHFCASDAVLRMAATALMRPIAQARFDAAFSQRTRFWPHRCTPAQI